MTELHPANRSLVTGESENAMAVVAVRIPQISDSILASAGYHETTRIERYIIRDTLHGDNVVSAIG